MRREEGPVLAGSAEGWDDPEIGIEWPDIQADPGDFVLTLSASANTMGMNSASTISIREYASVPQLSWRGS